MNNDLILNNVDTYNSNNSIHGGELSQTIKNFHRINLNEIEPKTTSKQIINCKILPEKDLSIMVDEIIEFVFKMVNKGKSSILNEKSVLDFLNNQNIVSNEILYNWISNHQNNSSMIFLFGYFKFFGIETSKDHEKAFDLFMNASKQDHILAQCYVGICYEEGYGITKDGKLALMEISLLLITLVFVIKMEKVL